MASWFKKSKRNGITYTTYTDGSKPTTWSQSFGSGSYRQTLTHRGGKVTETITRKSGGYTNIKKRLLNKTVKPKKVKAFKPKRTKWAKPKKIKVRSRRSVAKKTSLDFSMNLIYILLMIAFLPIIIDFLF